MKAPTLLGIALLLTVACFGLSTAIPGPLGDRFRIIGGCMVLGFGGLAYIAAAGVDYSKKKRQWEAERASQLQTQTELEPLPADTSPESTGSPTEEITPFERFYRSDEQAKANDYSNPNAPADTVQVTNVDAAQKPGKTFELEMTI